jgi:hypothetical protein
LSIRVRGLISLVLLLCSGGLLQAQDITSNLVGHWTFDNGWTSAVGGLTLTPQNGITFATGKIGSAAASFDGTDDYASRPSVTFGLDGTTALSVAVWLKSPDAYFRPLLAKPNPTNTSFRFVYAECCDNFGNVAFRVESLSSAQYPQWVSSGVTLNDGQWHSVVFAWQRNAVDATDAAIYIDGVSVTTTFSANGYTSSFALEDAASTFYVGTSATLGAFWSGQFDELRLFGRKLTSADAAAYHGLGRRRRVPLLF